MQFCSVVKNNTSRKNKKLIETSSVDTVKCIQKKKNKNKCDMLVCYSEHSGGKWFLEQGKSMTCQNRTSRMTCVWCRHWITSRIRIWDGSRKRGTLQNSSQPNLKYRCKKSATQKYQICKQMMRHHNPEQNSEINNEKPAPQTQKLNMKPNIWISLNKAHRSA